MLPSPLRDQAVANRLDDLASALAAGLAPEDALAARPQHPALARRGPPVTLAPGSITATIATHLPLERSELLVLAAAERAGTLELALRERARARRLRGEVLGEVFFRLAYPLFLVVAAFVSGTFVGILSGQKWLLPLAVLGLPLVAGAAGAVWLGRALRRGSIAPDAVPWLGPWLAELGEIPVLQTLHGLYGAGVRIDTALPEAAATAPFGALRARCSAAGALVAKGSTLADSLVRADALLAETRLLLATAERAGDLEGALARATQRRLETFAFKTRWLARILVGVALAMAFGFAAWVILSAYQGLYQGLPR